MNRAQKINDLGHLLAETYRAMMTDGDDAGDVWLERLARGQAPYSPLFHWLSEHGDAGPMLETPRGRAVPWGTYLFDGGTDLKPVVIG